MMMSGCESTFDKPFGRYQWGQLPRDWRDRIAAYKERCRAARHENEDRTVYALTYN